MTSEHTGESSIESAPHRVFGNADLFLDIFRHLTEGDRKNVLCANQAAFRLGVGEKWRKVPLRRLWDAEVYAGHPDQKTSARGQTYLRAIVEISLEWHPGQEAFFTRKTIRATLEEFGRLCPNLRRAGPICLDNMRIYQNTIPTSSPQSFESQFSWGEYGDPLGTVVVHRYWGYPKLHAGAYRLFTSIPRKEGRKPKRPVVWGVRNSYRVILDTTALPTGNLEGIVQSLLDRLEPDTKVDGLAVARIGLKRVFRLLDMLDARFPTQRMETLWLMGVPMDKDSFHKLCLRLPPGLRSLGLLRGEHGGPANVFDVLRTGEFVETIATRLPKLETLDTDLDCTKIGGLSKDDFPITSRPLKSGSVKQLRLAFDFAPDASEDQVSVSAFLAALRNLSSLLRPEGSMTPAHRNFVFSSPLGAIPDSWELCMSITTLLHFLKSCTIPRMKVIFGTTWNMLMTDFTTMLGRAAWDENDRILSEEVHAAMVDLSIATRFFADHERQAARMSILKAEAEHKLRTSGFAVDKIIAEIEEDAAKPQEYPRAMGFPSLMIGGNYF